MRVDHLDLRIGEELADARIGLAGLGENSVSHHPVLVEAAQRQDARFEHRRDLVDIFGRLLVRLGHEDRMTGSIGVRDIMADVIEQQYLLPDIPIGEAYPARKGRIGDGHPHDAELCKLIVRKSEQRTVWRGIQADYSIGHVGLLRFVQSKSGNRPGQYFTLPKPCVQTKNGAVPITFHAGDLDSEDVKALLAFHFDQMRSTSPPEACHVLAHDGLRDPAVTLWSAREDGQLVGVGALKEIAPDHGEVKSMRTVSSALGRGIGRAMLRHIVAEAKARGYKRLSLETGNTEPFAAALHLYASEGFQPWGPFAGYSDTPLSSFLTRRL